MGTTVRLMAWNSAWLARHGLLLGLLLPLPGLAWNAAGHRLAACIAWDQLDPHTRSGLSQLLRQHPDYARWRGRAGDPADADPERTVFIEASTWPDEIRKDRRFYDPGVDAPTSARSGFPDMERHRDWHYVNRPLRGSAKAHSQPSAQFSSGRLDRQLPALAQILGAADTPDGERSYALPWLMHLTADAHQPLHTVEESDGHALTVINPFNPRQRSTSLHAFWDDLPGPPWLRGERLDEACRALAARYSRPPASTSGQWIAESWRIARQGAHPPGNDTVPTITAEFYVSARQIAERRIAQAGYRLADLLRDLLDR